jgi:hypothetical protein
VATDKSKNPKRVKAGKQNGALRRPWSDAERQRQRTRCMETKPWKHATGPRSVEGKAISSLNSIGNTPVPKSVQQAHSDVADTADTRSLMERMEAWRRALFPGR